MPSAWTPTRVLTRLVVIAVAATTLAACGVTRGDPSRDLEMLIPNSPGGGYDLTGRTAVRIMEEDDITGGSFEVRNLIGAGGSVAMARLMNEEGNTSTIMTVGLGVVGSLYSFGADYRLQDATPVAQLIEEQEGVFVPADSPFRTVQDFVDAWKADPSSVKVGGGSSPGGPDHLFPMQLASTLEIDPRDVSYTTYDGGGPLTSGLLGEKIDVGFSGPGELAGQVASGELRVLAMSGAERSPVDELAEVPTLQESGIDLVFTNWRGVLAPPGISDERRDQYIDYLSDMRDTPEWREALERNGWTDRFRTGDEYEAFLTEQDERVSSTLEELGLL
ncbi:Bug family tripartite tricarboxylate transporter substrate binding protein [Solicola sp. PLA-1-18]|uniref:Bug family tripartite tricarboxylate transporter substrate binding protein n=1 Tax=Solicola sp. PLA-1-18 TaxID=3380532 RepID=UPI003B7A0B90